MALLPTTGPDPGGGWWGAFRRAHLYDYNATSARYWVTLAIAGAAALLLAANRLAVLSATDLWQIAGWSFFVALAAAFPIEIPRHAGKLHLAVGESLTFLLLALYGPAAAVLAVAMESLVGMMRISPPTRLSGRVTTVAGSVVAMTVAAESFGLIERWASLPGGLPAPAAHLAALTGSALLHFLIGTAVLMMMICLKRGAPISVSTWFKGNQWVGALYLFSAAIAGLLSLCAQHFGRPSVAVGVLVLGLSLALLRSHFGQELREHEAQEARVNAAEADSKLSQRRFHSAFSQASIGMAIVSSEGDVLQANQALHDLLGDTQAGIVGRPFTQLLHAGDAPLLERHVADLLERRCDRFSIELRCSGSGSGGRREIWVSLHCALFDDAGPSGAGLIFQLHDITSRRDAEGELRHVAYHDSLTDLANRNCFQQRLSVAVERSRSEPGARFAVMMLDLDRFKLVNDSLGHGAGDELLKEVARRLAACVRPKDLVARLGGDEFALLIEDSTGNDDTIRLGERLLAALEQPIQINGTELRPKASIGLTFSDLGYREPDEMLRDADLAMYQAKSGGKGRLALFDATLHEHAGHKLQLEADLRRAIGEGQLSLAFQPLFDLGAQRLHGFEALARWTHPVRGTVSPAVFIALAEETGCIEALTAWAVDEAARQFAAWHGESPLHGELSLHVNVSGKDLAQPQFVARVRESLQRHGLPAHQLVLEITESALMEQRERALKALDELCELGVKVGIDDFGTGYSSLAYLSTLPFDCLKIDRSFVSGMDKNRKNLEIVRTVVSLGRSLNKQVVAEGIETPEQLERIRQMGATIGQGYLLSRPLSPSQALELLRRPVAMPTA